MAESSSLNMTDSSSSNMTEMSSSNTAASSSSNVEVQRHIDDEIEILIAHEISSSNTAASSSSNVEVQRLVIDETETLTGHEIIYSFAVHRILKKEAWSFALDYNAQCPSEPTTWTFGVYYEKVPEPKDILCSVILKRTDNKDFTVMAFALVTFVDVNGKVARFTESVCCGKMSGGDEKQGSISNKLKTELFDQELIVRISISILECHVLKV